MSNFNILKYIQIILILFLILNSVNCKKTRIKSFEETLREYQWRKTEVAVYDINNEIETYTFLFDNALDCEKNSVFLYSSLFMDFYNLCDNYSYSYKWELTINNDSIIYTPFSDSLSVFYKRYIVAYTNKDHILQYDTIIKGEEKIIKETYTAYEK